MAYNKTRTYEQLDPNDIKVFTPLTEGIPLGKPFEVAITAISEFDDKLRLDLSDSFGHNMQWRIFQRSRDAYSLSFALRQLLSSLTQTSEMFRTLVSRIETDQLDWDHLIGCKFKIQYELGTGFYVGNYLNNFVVINENYELLTDTTIDSLYDARMAGISLGLKEGWPQISGFSAPKSAVQMGNAVILELNLGEDYAVNNLTECLARDGIEVESETSSSINRVERNGTRQVSSSLPLDKRF